MDDLESKVNQSFKNLMKETKNSVDKKFYLDARKYFNVLKNSRFYEILKKMPKGVLTHHHTIVHGDPEYLSNIVINDDKYFIDLEKKAIMLIFDENIPENFINIKQNYENGKISKDQIKDVYLFSDEDKIRDDHWTIFDHKIKNMFITVANTKYYKKLYFENI